ncbi:MAG: hypothetical protein LBG57_12655 [Treponema sp.]|jgi:hypothetical protein|nr:hypothetical protein [Treponema sp.]
MKAFIGGLLLIFLISCASMEERKQLSAEAEKIELGDTWWNDGRSFDSLEEAKHFVEVLFVKAGQMTKLHSKKGLNGVLKPKGSDVLWTPADNKVSVNWHFRISSGEGHWLDLSKDKLGKCHSAILHTAVWYQGKGIILSWYGIEEGWKFSNNIQRQQWNEKTICEYPIGLTKNRAWEYLGYMKP